MFDHIKYNSVSHTKSNFTRSYILILAVVLIWSQKFPVIVDSYQLIGSAYIYVKITTPYLACNIMTNRFRHPLLFIIAPLPSPPGGGLLLPKTAIPKPCLFQAAATEIYGIISRA